MAKKPKRKPTANDGRPVEDPILANHAMEDFGVGRKWLKLRIAKGEIRAKKVGRHLVVDRSDVERLLPEDHDLVARAIRKREERKRGQK